MSKHNKSHLLMKCFIHPKGLNHIDLPIPMHPSILSWLFKLFFMEMLCFITVKQSNISKLWDDYCIFLHKYLEKKTRLCQFQSVVQRVRHLYCWCTPSQLIIQYVGEKRLFVPHISIYYMHLPCFTWKGHSYKFNWIPISCGTLAIYRKQTRLNGINFLTCNYF
jgi:hypothetical protein